ncbi:MAG: hypothetical protein NC038_04050 [Paludibacter sp.]|nr:hypothetical protein [Muribaculum sp.]MCM1481804.1 hypothetical protein [Paludibacter sp.]MCM1577167.1 hypothetical protein [Bacteroides sp.]
MVYKPLLISVSRTSGVFSPDLEYNSPFDTKERFGLWIKHNPFSLRPKPKNIISQTWQDEEGDDVYIPNKIYHEPYEVELEFIYYSEDDMANVNIIAFLKELEGRWLKIYDSYTGIGRQGVYMIECTEEPSFRRRENDYVSFSVKFKVNDPDTDITLNI